MKNKDGLCWKAGEGIDYDRLLRTALELGFQLMSSGAEIYRVEESIRRLLRAYGLESPEVFAVPNCVIVSVTTPEGRPLTQMRRIPVHGINIELLERCNGLCRRLCAHPPAVEEAQAQISALAEHTTHYAPWQFLLAYGAAPACFSPLFGGGVLDSLSACLCGLAVGLCLLYGSFLIGRNGFFRTAICSAVGALLAQLLVDLGLGQRVDVVTISTLMLLVPGVALTNAMREIMAGDIISGLCRTAEAILTAGAIALGAAAGPAIGQIF